MLPRDSLERSLAPLHFGEKPVDYGKKQGIWYQTRLGFKSQLCHLSKLFNLYKPQFLFHYYEDYSGTYLIRILLGLNGIIHERGLT